MPVYLELFHGRRTIAEQLDDWGSEGPILGPFAYVHTTYGSDIKIETVDGKPGVLTVVGEEVPDLLYYNNTYYGDWSVFSEAGTAVLSRLEQYDAVKAALPAAESDQGTAAKETATSQDEEAPARRT